MILLLLSALCDLSRDPALPPERPLAQDVRLELTTGRRTYVVGEPVKFRYEFSARYLEPHGGSEPVLESDDWDVEVEPPPDRHRDAYEAYTKELARYTAWPLHEQPTTETIDKAFDFVERFPESPWTNPLRRMALAFMKWEDATPIQRERWERLCETDPPREIGDAPSPCPQRR